MNVEVLSVGSSLDHDGDGLVRYTVTLTNGSFHAAIEAWGDAEDHLRLATALEGFPQSTDARCTYTFGSPGTGICTLDFSCIDALGHVGVWAAFESTYPVSNLGRSLGRFETASLFMRCDPNSIDEFIAGLRSFAAGSPNRACIAWQGP